MKKLWGKAAVDGLLQGLFFCLLGEFVISKQMAELSYTLPLWAAVGGGAIFSVVYAVFVLKEPTVGRAIGMTLAAVPFFVLFPVLFQIPGICVFPPRETNNADGLLIMLALGGYLLVALVLRIGVLAAAIVRIHLKNRDRICTDRADSVAGE